MKILSVVGARPNFMKVASIINAIRQYNENNCGLRGVISHILVHTGQHYDKDMSDSFFEDLGLPKPDVFLGVGSASHAVQTSEIMKKFEGVLLQEKPNIVTVVGDVNSTLGCALVASKISYDSNGSRPFIAHVESGLRSFDRTMPEETNRILTDHISDFLFVTEESGIKNLKREGISADKIHFVGNTMIDTLLAFRQKAEESTVLDRLGLIFSPRSSLLAPRPLASGPRSPVLDPWSVRPYALLTLHRPSSVDNKEPFADIIQALRKIAEQIPIIFPCHPRTRNSIYGFGLENNFHFLNNEPGYSGEFAAKALHRSKPVNSINTVNFADSINLIDPLGYVDFLCLMSHAKIVLTDSGGIQEETTILGIPCITLRENTERPVTITQGTNMLAGVEKEKIISAFEFHLGSEKRGRPPKFWDGKAAERIINFLARKGIN